MVETDPPGAEVELSTRQTCTTPCPLELPRKHSFVATIARAGYEPVTATVASDTSGGGVASMAGNALFGNAGAVSEFQSFTHTTRATVNLRDRQPNPVASVGWPQPGPS